MIGKLLEGIMVLFSIIGAVLVAHKTRDVIGFKIWITSSAIGVIFGAYYHHWMFVMLQAMYIVIDTYALKRRTHDENKSSESPQRTL